MNTTKTSRARRGHVRSDNIVPREVPSANRKSAGEVQCPGALVRGGSFANGADAGVFAVDGGVEPTNSVDAFGLRGAR